MFIVFICCVEFYILFGNFSCDSGKLRFFSAACRFLVFDLEMWRVSGKNLTMILQKTQKYMFNTRVSSPDGGKIWKHKGVPLPFWSNFMQVGREFVYIKMWKHIFYT